MSYDDKNRSCRGFDLNGLKVIDDWFGSNGCLGEQAAVIRATLLGKDVYAVMPARSGKSACYQLPARLGGGEMGGTTIVLSPFPSLCRDKCESFVARELCAFSIDSQSTFEEKIALYARITDEVDPVDIIYMTPEYALQSEFGEDIFNILYDMERLARIVIDNADYVSLLAEKSGLALGALKEGYSQTPMLCLSDSPSRRCREKLQQQLGLNPAKVQVFTSDMEVPSVMYQVVDKADKVGDMIKRIAVDFHRQSGLIYCRTRRETEAVAEELREKGINAAHYHAQRPDKEAVQNEWERERVDVLVTTNAFCSQGSCSPRFIFHHSIPESIETYFRETSRDAFSIENRPDLGTCAVLYYSEKDVERRRWLIQTGIQDPDEDHGYRDVVSDRPRSLQNNLEKQIDVQTDEDDKTTRFLLNRFIQMIRFANEKVKCRKTMLHQYYGYCDAPERCLEYLCDNCENNFDCPEPTQINVSRYASYALRLIHDSVKSGRRITKTQAAECLACLDNKVLRAKNARTLQSYGLLAKKSMQTILWILTALETRYIIGGDPVNDPRGGEYVHVKILSSSFANAIHNRQVKIKLPAFQVIDNTTADDSSVSVLNLDDVVSTEDMVRMVEVEEDESSVSSEESFISIVAPQPGPSILANVKQELLNEELSAIEPSEQECPTTFVIPAKRVTSTCTEPKSKRQKQQ